jgi:hypothetical protein
VKHTMGMARLNVWITDLGRPCEMSKRDWVVAVFQCDGKVLEWCGRKYDSVPAKCGHAEFELPPGCYVIRASAHTWWSEGHLYGNWATDRTVVQACCDEHHCVTLYAPSAQACWIPLIDVVIPTLAKTGGLPNDAVKRAQPLREIMDKLPATEFEKGEARELKRIFEAGPQKDTG